MAGKLPRDPSRLESAKEAAIIHVPEEPQLYTCKWYFTKQEIEDHSPSRKDGIDHEKESHLRKLYCSFLQELGMELKVPQVTIATAMMLCHRFYMHQSHAKNDWQTIATVCMFLACKAEETPRWLSDLVVVAYKLVYKWDPSAPRRIKQREVYDKQKELLLVGERLLLATVAFDLNIQHPYKPLVAALKRLDISQKELVKVAWNFVNDWLRTTLCLQYKPHYIAAGSIFLAAKFQKVKLPTVNGKIWWMQFDVSPKQLEEVIQHMTGLLEQNRKQALPPTRGRVTETKPVTGKKELSDSPQSVLALASSISSSAEGGGIVKSDCDSMPVKEIVKSDCNSETVKGNVKSDCDSETVKGNVKSDCDSEPVKVMIKSDCDSETVKGIVKSVCEGIVKSDCDSEPAKGIVKSDCDSEPVKGIVKCDCNSEPLKGIVKSDCDSEPVNGIDKSDYDIEPVIANGKPDCDSEPVKGNVKSDCNSEPLKGESNQNTSLNIISVGGNSKLNVDRIKEALKRRRQEKITKEKLLKTMEDEMDGESWIERELENGIVSESVRAEKRRRL